MDLGFINYVSQYITSPGSTNKPGYVILIGTSTQHPTTDYKPPAGYTFAPLISLTNYRICIYYKICLMSIPMLYLILIHPFLLPLAPKCLLMHQFHRDQPVNQFLIFSIVYLCNLYSRQAPMLLTGVYGTGTSLCIIFIYPVCTL